MPGRSYNAGSYRYGFQNQEMDNEIKGVGNSVNYKYRMHDPRIGRFFAVDPLTAKYPHYSPYSFSGNKVIAFVELEGLEEADFRYRMNPMGGFNNVAQGFADYFGGIFHEIGEFFGGIAKLRFSNSKGVESTISNSAGSITKGSETTTSTTFDLDTYFWSYGVFGKEERKTTSTYVEIAVEAKVKSTPAFINFINEDEGSEVLRAGVGTSQNNGSVFVDFEGEVGVSGQLGLSTPSLPTSSSVDTKGNKVTTTQSNTFSVDFFIDFTQPDENDKKTN